MDIYDFINTKEECHKMTFPRLNATVLVNGCAFFGNIGDNVNEIRMNQELFSEFMCNAFSVNVENSVYERTIRTMKFMNAQIVIDNDILDSIVVLKGQKDDGMSILKIYIGTF